MAKYTLKKSVTETVKLTIPHEDSFFTGEELEIIKSRVNAYTLNNEPRSGGSYLLKELEKVEYFKEGLLTHINNITEALKPKERTRQTVDEALNAQERKIITQVKQTLKGMPEKILREIARLQIGDTEENYTLDELWLALAVKQVTGKTVEVDNLVQYSCNS